MIELFFAPPKINFLEQFIETLPKKVRREYKRQFDSLLAVYRILPIRVLIDEILLEKDAEKKLELLLALDKYLQTFAKFSRTIFIKPKPEFEQQRLVSYLEGFAKDILKKDFQELIEKHSKNVKLDPLQLLLGGLV